MGRLTDLNISDYILIGQKGALAKSLINSYFKMIDARRTAKGMAGITPEAYKELPELLKDNPALLKKREEDEKKIAELTNIIKASKTSKTRRKEAEEQLKLLEEASRTEIMTELFKKKPEMLKSLLEEAQRYTEGDLEFDQKMIEMKYNFAKAFLPLKGYPASEAEELNEDEVDTIIRLCLSEPENGFGQDRLDFFIRTLN